MGLSSDVVRARARWRFRPPEAYPAEALATFNTHDLPSFRGWLRGHDLRVKRAIGLDPGETDELRATLQALRAIFRMGDPHIRRTILPPSLPSWPRRRRGLS